MEISSSETIEIALSKQKLVMLLLACIVFVTGGFLLAANPSHFLSFVARSTTVIFITGVMSILFFGTIGCFIAVKLRDSSPGLVISNKGITDNSSGIAAGFIPWDDITEITEMTVVNQKIICVIVKNPQYYIDKQKSLLKREAMQANNSMYGAAIQITANGLKISYPELKGLLEMKFDKYATI